MEKKTKKVIIRVRRALSRLKFIIAIRNVYGQLFEITACDNYDDRIVINLPLEIQDIATNVLMFAKDYHKKDYFDGWIEP